MKIKYTGTEPITTCGGWQPGEIRELDDVVGAALLSERGDMVDVTTTSTKPAKGASAKAIATPATGGGGTGGDAATTPATDGGGTGNAGEGAGE